MIPRPFELEDEDGNQICDCETCRRHHRLMRRRRRLVVHHDEDSTTTYGGTWLRRFRWRARPSELAVIRARRLRRRTRAVNSENLINLAAWAARAPENARVLAALRRGRVNGKKPGAPN